MKYHPENDLFSHLLEAGDRCKESNYSFSIFVASITHDLGKLGTPKEKYPSHISHENNVEFVKAFIERHRFDVYTNNLCITTNKNHMRTHLLERISKKIKLIRYIRSVRRNLLEDFYQSM